MATDLIERQSWTPTPNATETFDFKIPGAIQRWTLFAVPQNNAAVPNPITLDIYYRVGGAWFQRNPPGAVTAMTLNVVNVVTSEDVLDRFRVVIATGATAPDQDLILELWGAR